MKIMLTLRCARQTRALLSSSPFAAANVTIPILVFSFSQHFSFSSDVPVTSSASQSEIHRNEISSYFRQWFTSRKHPLYERIFEILRTEGEDFTYSALSCLNLFVTEALILDVLRYGRSDVLSCLKFFDWTGRQPGFHHTRSTFHAIFRIISQAKMMSLMMDFLHNYTERGYAYKIRYHNVLVIGYAVAGKCETALQVYGRMRFRGVDLDEFSYHILLNALVEHGYFDMVDIVAREIRLRGFQNEATHSIMMKHFCKQNQLESGAEYLRNLAQDDSAQLSGIPVGTFVDALCKDNQFERAALFIDEFRSKGCFLMDHAYGVWIRGLIQAGNLEDALGFLKDKQVVEGYVPDVFRYNMLMYKLLRENRVEDVYDLLLDMKERDVMPDDVTMNAVLCLLCKVGKMDIAMDLYDSKAEFGLSVNYMAYNYLINTLSRDANVDEAYRVMWSSIGQGYFPGRRAFSVIIDALSREGRVDKVKELVRFTLDSNLMPSKWVYDRFISALCRARRFEEAYSIHGMRNRFNTEARKTAYTAMIKEFSKPTRGDIAVNLLIEMQEKGYHLNKKLYRGVIRSLCETDDPDNQFFRCLEMQLAHPLSSPVAIYSYFIDGAGYARKPKLATQVYEMMIRNGLQPHLRTNILLLQSYLNNGKFSQAFHLFRDVSMRRSSRKLWRTMIIGLVKAKRPDYASLLLDEMKAKKLRPSVECYEELIKLHCDLGNFCKAIELVNDMTEMRRPISSFIGNVFLLYSLKSRKVYRSWAYLSKHQSLTPSCWMLGHVIGVFSGSVEGDWDEGELEQMIRKCFHIDLYTNNIMMRRLCYKGVDHAFKVFNRLQENGYEPNRWTYETIIHGLSREGRTEEARIWMEEMLKKGFHPSEGVMRIV